MSHVSSISLLLSNTQTDLEGKKRKFRSHQFGARKDAVFSTDIFYI